MKSSIVSSIISVKLYTAIVFVVNFKTFEMTLIVGGGSFTFYGSAPLKAATKIIYMFIQRCKCTADALKNG